MTSSAATSTPNRNHQIQLSVAIFHFCEKDGPTVYWSYPQGIVTSHAVTCLIRGDHTFSTITNEPLLKGRTVEIITENL